MSTRYSNSPELHLQIAESRYPRLFFLALVVLQFFNLWLLQRASLPAGALALLVLLLLALLTHAARHSWQRQLPQLHWRRGQWWIEVAGERRDIEILRWHLLPWLTYLAWREEEAGSPAERAPAAGGRRDALWLFADSAPRDGLRRLRVRLTLQRAV